MTTCAFAIFGVSRLDQGWFDIHGELYPAGYPRIPAQEFKCSAGWRSVHCGDEQYSFCDFPQVFITHCGKVSDAGKVAVAFSCVTFPIAFLAAILALARGFKASGNKMLTTGAVVLAWIATLSETVAWVVYLGVVKQFESRFDWDPAIAWALAISSAFLAAIGAILLSFAIFSKDSGSFSSGGISHVNR